MFEILASIGGGFAVGSAINMFREGIVFRPFRSPRARKKFEQKRIETRKKIKAINWGPEDLDTQWYDR